MFTCHFDLDNSGQHHPKVNFQNDENIIRDLINNITVLAHIDKEH